MLLVLPGQDDGESVIRVIRAHRPGDRCQLDDLRTSTHDDQDMHAEPLSSACVGCAARRPRRQRTLVARNRDEDDRRVGERRRSPIRVARLARDHDRAGDHVAASRVADAERVVIGGTVELHRERAVVLRHALRDTTT